MVELLVLVLTGLFLGLIVGVAGAAVALLVLIVRAATRVPSLSVPATTIAPLPNADLNDKVPARPQSPLGDAAALATSEVIQRDPTRQRPLKRPCELCERTRSALRQLAAKMAGKGHGAARSSSDEHASWK